MCAFLIVTGWSGRGVPSHSMSGSSPQFWHTPHSLNSGHCVTQSASVVHFRSQASVSIPSSGKSCVHYQISLIAGDSGARSSALRRHVIIPVVRVRSFVVHFSGLILMLAV